jgi:hypothetical protein
VEDHERNADGTVSDECQQRLEVDWSFGIYRCTQCDLPFATPYELHVHMTLSHSKRRVKFGKNGYFCRGCEGTNLYKKAYDKIFTFINHAISERHCDNIEFSCLSCHKVFWNLGALVKHYKEVHPGFYMVLCNHCGKIFPHAESAATHLSNKVCEEDERIVKPELTEIHKCQDCSYQSKLKRSLMIHRKFVHKLVKAEEIVKCEICHLE